MPTPDAAPSPPVPIHWVRVARGFSCLFWGLPLTLLLFAGVLRVPSLPGVPLPIFVLGILVTYLGAVYLLRAGAITPRWSRGVRRLFLLVFLQLYFIPFYHWWRTLSYEAYYAANVLGMVFCGLFSLFLINRLAGEVGLALGNDTLHVEAKLCGWSVAALMLFPFTGAVAYAAIAAQRFESSLYWELQQLSQVNEWPIRFFFLPLPLTMAVAWKAKEAVLHRLSRAEFAAGREPAAEPVSPAWTGK